ncbi:hypothetical protein Chor_002462 [Crotalus horridus]
MNKLPLLKKKDSKESNLQVNRDQQQWDRQEAHFSGSHPPTSPDSATRRTTQLLPLLVKSSAAPTQARKRVQLPVLVLPNLGQRTTLRTTPGTAQADDQQGEKEPVALPRVPERESSQRSSLSQGRRTSKALLPLYPELSDQCFQTFWESKEPLNGRSVTEMLEQMDEKEILDTILEHLRPSLHISAGPQLPRRKMDGLPSLHQKSALRESRSHLLSQEKGISEAIGVVAFCHLPEILVALRQVGHFVRAKKPALQEATFQRQIRTAVILCYGHAALGAQPEDLMPLAEHIVSEILFQYWTRNKAFDEHLSPMEITDLMLKIIEALTHEEKTISQAFGEHLSPMHIIDLMTTSRLSHMRRRPFHRLRDYPRSSRKFVSVCPTSVNRPLKKSVCHLASKRVNQVVDHLLEYSPDCDQ